MRACACVRVCMSILQNPSRWQNKDPVAYQQSKGYTYKEAVSTHLLYSYRLKSGGQSVKTTTFSVQKHRPQIGMCLALALTNLAEPHFVSVVCNFKWLQFVLCQIPKPILSSNDTLASSRQSRFCLKTQFLFKDKCIAFEWENVNSLKQNSQLKAEIHEYQPLFEATGISRFPPIFTSLQNYTTIFRYFNRFDFKSILVSNVSIDGFVVTTHRPQNTKVGVISFHCKGVGLISAQYVCDGRADCPGAFPSDEVQCGEQLSQLTTRPEANCSHLFDLTLGGSCRPYNFNSDSPNKLNDQKCENFFCSTGKTIDCDKVDDLVIDCSAEGEDEKLFLLASNQILFSHCREPHQIPCWEGHPRCFNLSDICSFVLSKEGHLWPCRRGEHLQLCKHFQCNVMHKCPDFYCIPWKYVCNRRWDCPQGTDEERCDNLMKCVNLFKCRETPICVHLTSLCDAYFDCPLRDDEDLCSLLNVMCPLKCKCSTVAVFCSEKRFTPNQKDLMFFLIILVERSSISGVLLLSNIVHFSFVKSNLEDLCILMQKKTALKGINVHHNQVTVLTGGCFCETMNLQSMDLSSNLLSQIHKNTFAPLVFLVMLNLSYNSLHTIDASAFQNLTQMRLLSLVGVNNVQTDVELLNGLQLELLEVNDTNLCCLAPGDAACSIPLPPYFSCQHLLVTSSLRTILQLVSIFLIFLNTISVICQRFVSMKGLEKMKARGHMTAVISLCDTLFSLPFFILWTSDSVFGRNYVFHSGAWKSSLFCFAVCSLFFTLIFLSPALLSLFSTSRYMVVKYPLKTKFKQEKFVIKFFLSFCIVVFASGILVTFIIWLIDYYIFQTGTLTSICSPFINSRKMLFVVKFTKSLLISVQILSVAFVCIVHIKLHQSVLKSQRNVQHAVSVKKSNVSLISQLIILTVSNCLCWLPSAGIVGSSFVLNTYPRDLLMWMTVAIAPVNSLIDPLVFGIISVKKILQA